MSYEDPIYIQDASPEDFRRLNIGIATSRKLCAVREVQGFLDMTDIVNITGIRREKWDKMILEDKVILKGSNRKFNQALLNDRVKELELENLRITAERDQLYDSRRILHTQLAYKEKSHMEQSKMWQDRFNEYSMLSKGFKEIQTDSDNRLENPKHINEIKHNRTLKSNTLENYHSKPPQFEHFCEYSDQDSVISSSNSDYEGRPPRLDQRYRWPHNSKTSKRETVPLIFNGEGCWDSFLFHFENEADRHNWSDRKARKRLFGCLHGEALDFAMDIRTRDYYKLRKSLCRQFGNNRKGEHDMVTIRNSHSNRKETAPDEYRSTHVQSSVGKVSNEDFNMQTVLSNVVNVTKRIEHMLNERNRETPIRDDRYSSLENVDQHTGKRSIPTATTFRTATPETDYEYDQKQNCVDDKYSELERNTDFYSTVGSNSLNLKWLKLAAKSQSRTCHKAETFQTSTTTLYK